MISEEQKEQMRALREQGYSYYEIAQAVSTTQDSVRNFFYRERQLEKTEVDVISTLLKENEKLKRQLHKIRIQDEIDKAFADRIKVPSFHRELTHSLPEAREEAVLMLSDIHYGMLHKGLTNTYTPEIAKDRLYAIIANTKEIIHRYYPHITTINVFLLGDLIEGYGIFRGQQYSSIPITQQLIEFPPILAGSLSQLDFNMKIYAVRGNHGRLEKGAPQHNWDTVIYHWLKKMLPDVPIAIATDFYLPVKIKNTEFVLLHGDGITSSKTPESYIERSVGLFTKMFKKQDIYFDYLVMGHYHSANKLTNAIVNGSVCGDTLLANQKLIASEEPKQVLFFVDEKWGFTNYREIKPFYSHSK